MKHYLLIIDEFHFYLLFLYVLKNYFVNNFKIFFQNTKLFYTVQYGFWIEHSTEFAALELVDRVIIEMDIADTSINIFLDLLKAFDTLGYKILL